MPTDEMPRALLKKISDTQLEGPVIDHPCAGCRLRLTRLGDQYVTTLIEERRVGEGLMKRRGDGWAGYVTDMAGMWWLSADAALREVKFHEAEDGA